MDRRKLILVALLALLLIATVVLAATLDLWAGSVDTSGALFSGQNSRLTKAVIGLVVFVVLGLFGIVYKGPKR